MEEGQPKLDSMVLSIVAAILLAGRIASCQHSDESARDNVRWAVDTAAILKDACERMLR